MPIELVLEEARVVTPKRRQIQLKQSSNRTQLYKNFRCKSCGHELVAVSPEPIMWDDGHTCREWEEFQDG